MLLCRGLTLAFTAATSLKGLNLTQHSLTRRPILQKVRRHLVKRLRLFVSIRFQVLFHSPPGVLFTFPSRYLFTIGHQSVFSLRWWSTLIHARFLVSRATQETPKRQRMFQIQGFNLLWQAFPKPFFYKHCLYNEVLLPLTMLGLGSSPFARRY